MDPNQGGNQGGEGQAPSNQPQQPVVGGGDQTPQAPGGSQPQQPTPPQPQGGDTGQPQPAGGEGGQIPTPPKPGEEQGSQVPTPAPAGTPQTPEAAQKEEQPGEGGGQPGGANTSAS